jgi:hypothetical protein
MAKFGKAEHRPPRKIGMKERRIILRWLADGWSENFARKKAKVGRNTLTKYKKTHPMFVQRMDDAKTQGIDSLEDAAHKRGVKGVLEPIIWQGKTVTYKRRYSDSLLTKMLEVRNPKYAVASPQGQDFADTMAGASERLLYKLDSIIEQAEEFERELRAGAN